MDTPIPQPLIFWLCAYRLNVDVLGNFYMPRSVLEQLLSRGLIETAGAEHSRHQPVRITEKGLALSDLHGPELGIDTIPTPAQS